MSRLYDRAFQSIAPLALNFATGYRTWCDVLSRSQFLPREALAKRQMERLRELGKYVFRSVPLFRKLGGTADFGDPAKLPVMTKTILRKHRSEAFADSGAFRFGHRIVTSGSTGEPLEFWIDRRSRGLRLASRYLFDHWIGINFGARCSRIIAMPSRLSRLYANEQQIRFSEVRSRTAPSVLRKILRFRPEGLMGHPSSLFLLAEAKLKAMASHASPIVSAVTSAETLVDSARDTIRDAFGCPVYNRYGLRELSGYIAQECQARGGLHVNMEHVFLEIVDDGGPVPNGTPGRIIVTDLYNHVMPLIRYDTGDIGILSRRQCPCGITWPLLESIQGRECDYVVLKDGSQFPLSNFAGNFLRSFLRSVAQVQFVQKRDGCLLVRIVPRLELSSDDVHRMRRYYSELLRTFDLELVSETVAKSGKRPLLIRE